MLFTGNKCGICSALLLLQEIVKTVSVSWKLCYFRLSLQEAGHGGFPMAYTHAVFPNSGPSMSPECVPAPHEDRIRSSTFPWFLFRHVAQSFRKVLSNS